MRWRLKFANGELYEQRNVVGLHLCIVCCTISSDFSAFFAPMNNYITFFCIGKDLYGSKLAVAFLGSVAGIFVNVERPQTKRTVVSGAVSKG